jgi:hypothetical protein
MIVLPFIPWKVVTGGPMVDFTATAKMIILYGILCGICPLPSTNSIHRELKLSTILLPWNIQSISSQIQSPREGRKRRTALN